MVKGKFDFKNWINGNGPAISGGIFGVGLGVFLFSDNPRHFISGIAIMTIAVVIGFILYKLNRKKR